MSLFGRVSLKRRGIALPFHDHGTRRGEGSASRSGRSLTRERRGAHCTRDWVGPRAGLDRCGISHPQRDSIPGPSSTQPFAIQTTLPSPKKCHKDECNLWQEHKNLACCSRSVRAVWLLYRREAVPGSILPFMGMWRRVFWYKCIGILEGLAAFITEEHDGTSYFLLHVSRLACCGRKVMRLARLCMNRQRYCLPFTWQLG